MNRFMRLTRLIGNENLNTLKNKKVAVIGLGAVGSYAVEGIVRGGIGKIDIYDFDIINESNINRQLYALDSTLGKAKTDVAFERINDINPECIVKKNNIFINKDNINLLLDSKPDLVIDAIDSLNAKCEMLYSLYTHKIPVLSSMGAALRRDPFMIRFGDISETYGCSLAKRVRKYLRDRKVFKGVKCVYSTEQIDYKFLPSDKEMSGRNILGSLPTITGIFGLILANKALKELIEKAP